MARSRNPAIMSSAGASSNLRACAFEKARVEPSSRLSAGRSTSVTGFFAACPCRTRCLQSDDSAASCRRIVDAAAPSISRMYRSQAITPSQPRTPARKSRGPNSARQR